MFSHYSKLDHLRNFWKLGSWSI